MDEHRVDGWRNPRPIVERVEVTGDLVLQTPTHFGSGDPDPMSNVDMVLLRDPLEGKALLPGASIAGALRNYLREVTAGFDHREGPLVTALFGGSRGDDEGAQSPLIVDDSLAEIGSIELRDGVAIDPATGTASHQAKFDVELLPAGTRFPLHFELLINDGQKETLLKSLALALGGFEGEGEISLGARKRRGFGRCCVRQWTVNRYDLTKPHGLVAWLNRQPTGKDPVSSIAEALQVDVDQVEDARRCFAIDTTFSLEGSMLIRSGFGESDTGPDVVHLHSGQSDGSRKPIVAGTSLAGVLRHRALRIANTLRPDKGEDLVHHVFGGHIDGHLAASRVTVREAVVEASESLVQNRIKIDRFTGGAFETALFEEQPIFGDGRSRLTVHLELRNPEKHEIGLMLLLLKDLWTGDLPVGGESSVGRGRLSGIEAALTLTADDGLSRWKIEQVGQRLVVDQTPPEPAKPLQEYVDALCKTTWEVQG